MAGFAQQIFHRVGFALHGGEIAEAGRGRIGRGARRGQPDRVTQQRAVSGRQVNGLIGQARPVEGCGPGGLGGAPGPQFHGPHRLAKLPIQHGRLTPQFVKPPLGGLRRGIGTRRLPAGDPAGKMRPGLGADLRVTMNTVQKERPAIDIGVRWIHEIQSRHGSTRRK